MRRRAGHLRALRGCLLALLACAWSAPAAEPEPLLPAPSCDWAGKKYFPLAPPATCALVRLDLKADYRARFSREEIFAETDRDAEGPRLSYSVGELARSRPIRRTLFEAKGFFFTASQTEFGVLRTSLGLKGQVENPPRRPTDPLNTFNRTGRRALLERAGVHFLGVSAGVLPSFFNFTPTLGYTTPYATEQIAGLVAYTHAVESLSFTLSLEDQKRRRIVEAPWGLYRDRRDVDVVGVVRGAFPWGIVQFAAAAHPVKATASGCCGTVTGEATGWALGAGYEHWFDAGDYSDGIVFNVALARGALDYLNATNYPADFAVGANGDPALTGGAAFVVSYSRNWTPQVRTVLTASQSYTSLDAPRVTWRTRGTLIQALVELAPAAGVRVGLEVNYHRDDVNGADRGIPGLPRMNHYYSAVAFALLRF